MTSLMELTIDQALQQGVAAHKAGKLQEAEKLYRAIIISQPNHPDANHNLGVLAVSLEKLEVAIPHFKLAIEANPSYEQYWVSCIETLIKLSQQKAANDLLKQAKEIGLKGEKIDQLENQLGSNRIANITLKEELKKLLSLYSKGELDTALAYGNMEDFSGKSATPRFRWATI